MQKGIIRRRGESRVIGYWQADPESLVVETEEPELRRAADEILRKPQTIPVHAPDHHEFASGAVPLIEAPSTIKFLALFALEMEARGFELDPGEE